MLVVHIELHCSDTMFGLASQNGLTNYIVYKQYLLTVLITLHKLLYSSFAIVYLKWLATL